MAKTTKKAELESTPQSYQATVTAAVAVLRQAPGTADKPVATLVQGTKVTIPTKKLAMAQPCWA